MSEPFIGQIMMFAGNFAPRGWAFCDGQLLSIATYSALFSILGTTYGGDGVSTFALPDLRGRSPMHPGRGPGLSYRQLGETGGAENVTLMATQLPPHTHTVAPKGTTSLANAATPNGAMPAVTPDDAYAVSGDVVDMASFATGSAGGGLPVPNMAPYRCVSFVIALEGIYPTRS